MDAPPRPERTPRELVADACSRYGEDVVARWCSALLLGATAPDDPGSPSLGWIGGRHALAELARGDMDGRDQTYWVRVWAARAFLYAWTPTAAPAVCRGLADDAWRVREMCAKAVAAREVGEAVDLLPPLLDDPVPRVRSAALRALGAVADGDVADAVRTLLDDDDETVATDAEAALRRLSERLDREF